MTTPTRWHLGTAEVAYTDSGGTGETVLLIHGGGLADWFTPLAAAPALSGDRVIRMVRAGYTGAPVPAGLTVGDHAAHVAALLHHLDAGPAHVVAHSSGSTVALQFAVDHPHLVRSLTLCEPPLLDTLAAPADHDTLRTTLGPVIGAVMAATARGDLPAAFDTFMGAICGPSYRRVVTDTLGPGALGHAETHCGPFFAHEVPAVAAWTLDRAAFARLSAPVLLVQGGASPPLVHRLVSHLADRTPTATIATIPGAGHLLPLTHPTELAALLPTSAASAGRWA
jgi:pimeloyl-ACP methyl ester carboxylesterase